MNSVVLCVDDDRFVLQALSDQLNEWFGENYVIEKALSGEEGLLIIDEYKEQSTDIPVVISDYIMPSMRGDQFLEEVQKRDSSAKKIMLTGYSALEGVINAINNAALYRFVSKPWNDKDLKLTVTEAIRSYEQEKKLHRLSSNFKSMYYRYATLYKDLQECYDTTLMTLVGEIESRFPADAGHSAMVKEYCSSLAKVMQLSGDQQFTLDCLSLLHEVGKINFTQDELKQLEQAKLSMDYENPIVKRMNQETIRLTSAMGKGEFAEILEYQYKNHDESPTELSKILAVANTFANIMHNNVKSKQEAFTYLLKHVDRGLLDINIVKVFIRSQVQ